jgi:hypothetical protein
MTLANLLVITFVKILKMQLSKLKGLFFLISLASSSLGIKVIIAKFNLYMSKETVLSYSHTEMRKKSYNNM